VDSAEAIAIDVRARLGAGSGPGPSGGGTHRFFVTDLPERFTPIAGRFLGRPVERAEHVDV
jgi:glutamate racemase